MSADKPTSEWIEPINPNLSKKELNDKNTVIDELNKIGIPATSTASPVCESPYTGTDYSISPIDDCFECHMLLGDYEKEKNCWYQLSGSEFKVRGQNYLEDHVKVHSENSALKCVGVELLQSKTGDTEHLSKNPDSFVSTATKNGSTDYFFIYNIMIRGPDDCKSLISYFTIPKDIQRQDPTFYRLWKRMMNEKDEYINPHVKLIPGIFKGPWIVKKAVGNTPAIVGNKLRQVTYYGDNYMETVLDVSSNNVAKTVCGLAINYASSLIVDIGLVLEATETEDLPERMLGSYRLVYPDLKKCYNIDA